MHAGGHGFKSRPVHSFSGSYAYNMHLPGRPGRRPPSPRRPVHPPAPGRPGTGRDLPQARRVPRVRHAGRISRLRLSALPPPPQAPQAGVRQGRCRQPIRARMPGGARTPAASRRSADIIKTKKIKKKCGLHSRGLPCCTACPQGPSCTSRPRMGSHRVSRLPALRVGRRP